MMLQSFSREEVTTLENCVPFIGLGCQLNKKSRPAPFSGAPRRHELSSNSESRGGQCPLGGAQRPLGAPRRDKSGKTIPMLNGLGISASLGEIEQGGFVPLHEDDANEIVMVIKGQLDVGILKPRKAFRNTLIPGNIFLFPKELLHYLINSGPGKAVFAAAFSSPNPVFRLLYEELFANDVPSRILSQVIFLDKHQVRKFKARFNGTG
ncbi:germin-like protein 8-14 [Vigna radiata var. radiata]|uniref:Germin-like protein n=1 Tax=Vigna radiata var. radiata TaxID=3916 RepID=A0A1S3VAT7_VIGRR|nr:germin-like protein 8-14 [Vigna radiata var. radiata]